MIRSVTIEEYFALPGRVILADVRTPAEFERGHVPGAYNLPIFDNEERVQVGTTYKLVGREAAILLGFDLTGSKWRGFIEQALKLAPSKKIAVHCWRGGMRSGAMAWALDLYGFDVYLVKGGYKRFRNWALDRFKLIYRIKMLGGLTGSGKTAILHEFARRGQQVIDLERLANHQGSAYGSMNELIQPTQEQFENELAYALHGIDPQKHCWVEDESSSIGRCLIPRAFWQQMRIADLVDIQVDVQHRVGLLAASYGTLDKNFLIACTEKIRKRFGPEQTRDAIRAITENRMEDFVKLALTYYDKTYRAGLNSREDSLITSIALPGTDAVTNAILIEGKIKE